jgi:hypothetical protein
MDETAAPAPPAEPRSIGSACAPDVNVRPSIWQRPETAPDPRSSKLEADRFAELNASIMSAVTSAVTVTGGEPGAELVNSYPRATRVQRHRPDADPHAERAGSAPAGYPLVDLGCAVVLLIAIWWVLAGSRSGTTEAHRAYAGGSAW